MIKRDTETRFSLLLFIGVAGGLLYFFQMARTLEFQGVEANLVLIFFAVMIFFGARSFMEMLIPLVLVLILSFAVTPFWFSKIAVLVFLAAAAYFGKRFLTGSQFTDAMIAIVVLTICLYGIFFLLFHTPLLFMPVFIELIMNISIGAAVCGIILLLKRL